MTVGNISDGASSERSGPFYVRLQNLPVSAGQKQIREFFLDLAIPIGGISFHEKSAFVVFDNETDAAIALSKDKELIEGKKVLISNAVLKDVRRTQVKEARKKLVFSPQEQFDTLKPKKRIRPTKVKESLSVVASKKFCPDEIEFPVKIYKTSVLDIKANEIQINNEVFIKNGLRLPGEKVNSDGAKHCSLVEKIPELRPRYNTSKHADPPLILENNFGKNEVDLKDGKIVEKNYEYCFQEKFNSEKNESRKLVGKVTVQNNALMFLDEKATNDKDEIFFKYETNSRKIKIEEKVTGHIANSVFSQKVRDMTNRFPTKKTIKPTSVLTMNQFKIAYEGNVF